MFIVCYSIHKSLDGVPPPLRVLVNIKSHLSISPSSCNDVKLGWAEWGEGKSSQINMRGGTDMVSSFSPSQTPTKTAQNNVAYSLASVLSLRLPLIRCSCS